MKNSPGLLIFCGECADLMPFSTNLCKKSIFHQELRDLGAFNFVSSIQQSRTTDCLKACKMNVLVSGPVSEKSSW